MDNVTDFKDTIQHYSLEEVIIISEYHQTYHKYMNS